MLEVRVWYVSEEDSVCQEEERSENSGMGSQGVAEEGKMVSKVSKYDELMA